MAHCCFGPCKGEKWLTSNHEIDCWKVQLFFVYVLKFTVSIISVVMCSRFSRCLCSKLVLSHMFINEWFWCCTLVLIVGSFSAGQVHCVFHTCVEPVVLSHCKIDKLHCWKWKCCILCGCVCVWTLRVSSMVRLMIIVSLDRIHIIVAFYRWICNTYMCISMSTLFFIANIERYPSVNRSDALKCPTKRTGV